MAICVCMAVCVRMALLLRIRQTILAAVPAIVRDILLQEARKNHQSLEAIQAQGFRDATFVS